MTLRGFKYHADFPTRIVGCRMLVLLVVLLAVASADPSHDERCTIRKMLEELKIKTDLVKRIVFYADQRNGFNKTAVEPLDDESGNKRYGTFQLIDQLVCRGGVSETRDICHVECSNLVDNDLSDDIYCLYKLLEYATKNINTTDKKLQFLLNRSLRFQLMANVPDGYFERCDH